MVHRIHDSKVHGSNMGPTWGRQNPGGPHVGPMNFAIWDSTCGINFDFDWKIAVRKKTLPHTNNFVIDKIQTRHKTDSVVLSGSIFGPVGHWTADFPGFAIDQSHRYGRHQAACREPAGSYDEYSNYDMFWTWNAISFNPCSIYPHCSILAHR